MLFRKSPRRKALNKLKSRLMGLGMSHNQISRTVEGMDPIKVLTVLTVLEFPSSEGTGHSVRQISDVSCVDVDELYPILQRLVKSRVVEIQGREKMSYYTFALKALDIRDRFSDLCALQSESSVSGHPILQELSSSQLQWMSLEEICGLTGLTQITVRSYLRNMAIFGVVVMRRDGKPLRYALTARLSG